MNTGGDNPCYVSVDDKNRYVIVGHYDSGNLSAISLKEDGSLNTNTQIIQQEGSSINESRQSGSHVHSTVLSPDNRYLLTSNLGTDKVNIYKFDPDNTSEPLIPADPDFVYRPLI